MGSQADLALVDRGMDVIEQALTAGKVVAS
jgi:hypothetical protein